MIWNFNLKKTGKIVITNFHTKIQCWIFKYKVIANEFLIENQSSNAGLPLTIGFSKIATRQFWAQGYYLALFSLKTFRATKMPRVLPCYLRSSLRVWQRKKGPKGTTLTFFQCTLRVQQSIKGLLPCSQNWPKNGNKAHYNERQACFRVIYRISRAQRANFFGVPPGKISDFRLIFRDSRA